MSYRTLIVTCSDRVATITLNRPEKRNAINGEMIEELTTAFRETGKSTADVLIVTGAGKAFCAGMDLARLKELLGRSSEQRLQDAEIMTGLFRAVYECPIPTIAAVNGAAIAGGTGLATLCDFTLAVPHATFGYTEVRIGFLPATVSCFLVNQIGEKQARDLLLTGRIFDAQEALRLGLVTGIVDEDALLLRAYELATRLKENSPASLRGIKRLLAAFSKDELDHRFAEAIREGAAVRATPDFAEGISAFLEKRKPVWRK